MSFFSKYKVFSLDLIQLVECLCHPYRNHHWVYYCNYTFIVSVVKIMLDLLLQIFGQGQKSRRKILSSTKKSGKVSVTQRFSHHP